MSFESHPSDDQANLGHLEQSVSPQALVLDTTAPVVFIDEPLSGMVFNAGTVPFVSGRIVESGSVPTVTVGGVPGLVRSTGPGQFAFVATNVPLPIEGTNSLRTVATDAAGNVGQATVLVERATPSDISISGLKVTQTGIVDAPDSATPIIQETLVIGKTTFVTMQLTVLSASMTPTYIDDAVLEVLDAGGWLIGTVPHSSYSLAATAGMTCADLSCGLNFFVPGNLLTGTGPTVSLRFRMRFFVGGIDVGNLLLVPYTFKEVTPYELLLSPVELAWEPFDLTVVTQFMDMIARSYPVPDGYGVFSPTAPPPGSRGMEFVLTPPMDLDDSPPKWTDDWVIEQQANLRGTGGGLRCTDLTDNAMPPVKHGRQAGYPEDTNGNGFWEPSEIIRFCPDNSVAHERSVRMKAHLRSELFALRLDYNLQYNSVIPLPAMPQLNAPVEFIGVYINGGMNQALDGKCGGSGGDWAWNPGGNEPNCVRVLAQEYSHHVGIRGVGDGHSRNDVVLNGRCIPAIAGCGPKEGPEGPACDGQIPTATGAGYNLLNHSATPLTFSFMTKRDSNGLDTYLNLYARNEEFTFLAEEHETGWFVPWPPCPASVASSGQLPISSTEDAADEAFRARPEPVAMMTEAMIPWKIVGTLDSDTGDVSIRWAGPAAPGTPLTPVGAGPGELLVRDGRGALLAQHLLDLSSPGKNTHPEDELIDPHLPPGSGAFVAVIDLPAGANVVEMALGGVPVWSVQRGFSAPSVSVISPSGGEAYEQGSEISIEWNASDADPGSTLYFDIGYSPDGGATFQPLGLQTSLTQRTWRTIRTAGTGEGVVRVSASDGFDVDTVASPGLFTLEDAAPVLAIMSPPDGLVVLQDQELVLRTFAFDPEEGMLSGPSISWSSSVQGFLGTGATLVVRGLDPGPHDLTAEAVDGKGHVVLATSSVQIEADHDRDGLSDGLEMTLGLDPLDPRDSALDQDGDGLNIIAELFLGTDPSDEDSDGDGLLDGDEVRIGSSPHSPDMDGDGLPDGSDICPMAPDPDQIDSDGDGVGDECDNCSIANGGQEDLDRDGEGDRCDPDDDADGVHDAQDCAPVDAGAFAPPAEVTGLTAGYGPSPGEVMLSWGASRTGTGAVYDVVVGSLDGLTTGGFGSEQCQVSGHPGNQYLLPAIPIPGAHTFILVRERNSCDTGTWGTGTDASPRSITACP